MSIILTILLAAQGQAASLPAWMEGCWEQRTGERWTVECWTAPRGGMMMGSSRSGIGEILSEWETIQIVREDTDDPAVPQMTFWAAPGGQNRTMFVWIPSTEPGVTFVNQAHDYPQRIRYWREGRDLVAEISLGDGSKSRRWRYSPSD